MSNITCLINAVRSVCACVSNREVVMLSQGDKDYFRWVTAYKTTTIHRNDLVNCNDTHTHTDTHTHMRAVRSKTWLQDCNTLIWGFREANTLCMVIWYFMALGSTCWDYKTHTHTHTHTHTYTLSSKRVVSLLWHQYMTTIHPVHYKVLSHLNSEALCLELWRKQR